MWIECQPTQQLFSGDYGSSNAIMVPMATAVMSIIWERFCETVQNDPGHMFQDRYVSLWEVRHQTR